MGALSFNGAGERTSAYPHRLRPPAGVLASSLKTLRVFFTLAPSQVQVPVMGP